MASENDNLRLERELKEAKENLLKLRIHYEKCLSEMKQEVAFLKEQILAQSSLLENAVNHVNLLENQLREIRSSLL